jgi:hypothetical protein
MPCYLALVDLVLPNGTYLYERILLEFTHKWIHLDDIDRFNKLSELITDVIVPGWLYASSRIAVMIASMDALLLVVQALGSGSIRFLKVAC